MRLSLRHRLLLVPLLLLVGTALATAYAAWHAARAADARIRGRIDSIIQTLRGPPTFPLTSPVLKQMTQLTGARFALEVPREWPNQGIVNIENEDFWAEKVELPATHPNVGMKVTVLFPESIRREEIRGAVGPVLILGLGGGLLATLISWFVGQRLVNRIRAIDEGTRAVATGQFKPLPLPKTNDELRDLTASVNAMTQQLSANSETLKQNERLRVLGQVASGLAHQLRNAATGAKLAVELAQDHPDRESLEVALRQLQRMESILKQFLEISRPDSRPRPPADLRDVVEKTLCLVNPQAQHQQIQLRWNRPDLVIVRNLDAEQFSHLLENLLLNACDAAGPGGDVEIVLNKSAIEIIDSGPGPTDTVADKLFEPFITSKPGGIGLGLMVAKQAAEAHDATLTWQRREGRTVFRVAFDIQ